MGFERIPDAFDPHASDLGLGVEIVTLDHDKIGQFSGFDGAKLIGHAGEFGRSGGQRGECIVLGQAALDRLGQIGSEMIFILHPMQSE